MKGSRGDFDTMMILGKDSRKQLTWWLHYLPLASNALHHDNPSIVIYTDFSKLGWGAFIDDQKCSGGALSKSESQCH